MPYTLAVRSDAIVFSRATQSTSKLGPKWAKVKRKCCFRRLSKNAIRVNLTAQVASFRAYCPTMVVILCRLEVAVCEGFSNT